MGLLCAKANIPTIPLILGMVMGDTLEAAWRQVLGRSEGALTPFVTRPMSLVMLLMALLILLWPWLQRGLPKLTDAKMKAQDGR